MLIIVTFLDAAQLSWVRANLKSLPTWPPIASLSVQKSAVHTSLAALPGRFQDSQYLPQPLADLFQLSLACAWDGKGQWRLFAFYLGTQLLAGAGNRKALIIKQLFYPQHILHVNFAVHALACAALGGLELGKLSLPEAEDVAGQAAQPADLADAEVKLIGNDNFAGNRFPCRTFCKFMHGIHGTKAAMRILSPITLYRQPK
jgi:hypothetical protein